MSNLKFDFREVTEYSVSHTMADTMKKFNITRNSLKWAQEECRAKYKKSFCREHKCSLKDFEMALSIALYTPEDSEIARIYYGFFEGFSVDYSGLAKCINTDLYKRPSSIPDMFKDALSRGLKSSIAHSYDVENHLPIPSTSLKRWIM